MEPCRCGSWLCHVSRRGLCECRSGVAARTSSKARFFHRHASSFFFSNSMGAQIAICEALLEVVARKLGDRATRALARGERLISDLPIRRD